MTCELSWVVLGKFCVNSIAHQKVAQNTAHLSIHIRQTESGLYQWAWGINYSLINVFIIAVERKVQDTKGNETLLDQSVSGSLEEEWEEEEVHSHAWCRRGRAFSKDRECRNSRRVLILDCQGECQITLGRWLSPLAFSRWSKNKSMRHSTEASDPTTSASWRLQCPHDVG